MATKEEVEKARVHYYAAKYAADAKNRAARKAAKAAEAAEAKAAEAHDKYIKLKKEYEECINS